MAAAARGRRGAGAVPPRVGRARALTQAHELGASGENATDAILADPALSEAYEHGKNSTTQPPEPPAKKPPAQPPGPAQPPPGPGGGKGSRSPVFSPPKLPRGGTGGGLLLAVILYPVGLSIIKYGAAGPGRWFNAKFLNKVPGTSTSSPSSPPSAGGATPPGTHTSNGGIGPGTPAAVTRPPGQVAGGGVAGVVNV